MLAYEAAHEMTEFTSRSGLGGIGFDVSGILARTLDKCLQALPSCMFLG